MEPIRPDTIYQPIGRFLQVEHDLLFSRAYLSLSGRSKDLFHLLFSKLRWERGGNSDRRGKTKTGRRRCAINNGEIVATYEEIMEALGIGSRATVSRSIQELLERGFIDLTRPGCGKLKISSLFAISNRWRLYGEDGFILAPENRRKNEAVKARSKRSGEKLFSPTDRDRTNAAAARQERKNGGNGKATKTALR
ncbi:helix-turn-helix domain-containing protein [bacterium]|nr:helix-turn-helix domain-containing protein [bacterium]